MSTAPLTAAPRRALPRPHGLTWTVLRLHRAALWAWLAFVVITAGLLLWLYGPGASAAQHEFDTYGYYSPGGWDSAKYAYDTLFYRPATFINVATFAVPLFAGGALIGRELENGTSHLAWTQAAHPARWLMTKLAVPALALTAGTTLLVVLHRLLWNAHNGLLIAGYAPRDLYFSIGPATIALPLLGLAVGALVGLLVRRALPALAIAAAVQYPISALHLHLWPFQRTAPLGALPELAVRGGAVTSTGAVIRDPGCYGREACLAEHDITGFTRTYLPSPDYWPRQLLETGVVLALTAAVVAVAFGILRRRVAV
jgi:hypothetical protein